MVKLLHLLPAFFILTASTSSFSAASDPFEFYRYTCNGDNFTANSTFQSNLNALLSSLSSSTSTFANATKGSAPNTAYGLILCRGDATPSDCRACIQHAARNITSLCNSYKQATVWYDNCQLRDDDRNFFSIIYDPLHSTELVNVSSATDQETHGQFETALLDRVVYQAAYNSTLMYATGMATYNGLQKLYALAQCTRDLTDGGCGYCLQRIRGSYAGNERKEGGGVLGESCSFHYETYPFFRGEPTVLISNLSTTSTLPPTPPPPPSSPDAQGKEVVLT